MEGRINAIVNGMLIVLLGFLILQPDGPARSLYSDWRESVDRADRLGALWAELSEVAMPVKGPQNAPMVVEVGDYYCPVCRQAEILLESSTRAEKVRIGYLHFPLPSNPHAPMAARIAICASRAGKAREAHQLLMGLPRDGEPNVARISEELGLDAASLATCEESSETQITLDRHVELARRAGVPGTPTFIGDDDWRVGAVGWDELAEIATR